MYYCTYESKIGLLYLISDGESLIGCYLEGQKYFPNNIDNYYMNEELSILVKSKVWLEKYFNGENPSIDEITLNYIGTEFRKTVWEVLKEISYGKLVTYKHIAEKIAKAKGIKTMSAQAVGGAVGHNPLLIFIPCHRVIRTNGKVGGYSGEGGVKTKIKLLKQENIEVS